MFFWDSNSFFFLNGSPFVRGSTVRGSWYNIPIGGISFEILILLFYIWIFIREIVHNWHIWINKDLEFQTKTWNFKKKVHVNKTICLHIPPRIYYEIGLKAGSDKINIDSVDSLSSWVLLCLKTPSSNKSLECNLSCFFDSRIKPWRKENLQSQ